MKASKKICSICFVSLGTLLIVIGLVLIFGFEIILKSLIDSQLPLVNGSASYEAWLNPHTQADILLQFYVFDLQNKEDVVVGTSRPVVIQKGPYTYRELRPRQNVTFNTTDTLSYYEPKYLIFEESMSSGSDNDTFTTINIPAYSVAYMLNGMNLGPLPPAIAKVLKNFIGQLFLDYFDEDLFAEHTVDDILFGYNDKLIDFFMELENSTFYKTALAFGLKPIQIPSQLSLFVNGSNDGQYLINTGYNNITRYGEILQWEGMTALPFWSSKLCNMINGSDGSLWKPYLTKQDKMYLFSSDICRSIHGVYNDDVVIKGITSYRYIAPASAFTNYTQNPYNKGFCTPDVAHCLDSGVMNISNCKQGAPIIVSQPHFYQAALKYIDAVVGMQPDSRQHYTFLDIEPTSGLSIQLAKRLQLNLGLQYLPDFKQTEAAFKGKDLLIYPILWLNESAMIKDSGADKVRLLVYTTRQIAQISQYCSLGLGIIIIFLVIVFYIVQTRKNKDDDDTSVLVSPTNYIPTVANGELNIGHTGDDLSEISRGSNR